MEREFLAAPQRVLDRYAVSARSTFVDVPSTGGKAHALICGEGPPVVMVSGIGTPAAMWAPLMGQLQGFQLFAVDLPAYGLSGTMSGFAGNLRRNAVLFLTDVLHASISTGPPLSATPLARSGRAGWLWIIQPAWRRSSMWAVPRWPSTRRLRFRCACCRCHSSAAS